jgi:hypothetical protein
MSDLVIDPRILLMMKCKHVMKHFPEWRFSWENEETAHFEGWVNPGADRNPYQLRLCFNPQSPEVVPELYIWKPIILPSFEGGTINACTGHSTHTLCNGPEGRIQICHSPSGDWDASKSLIVPILRGVMWLYAYEGHRTTGQLISEYFPEN